MSRKRKREEDNVTEEELQRFKNIIPRNGTCPFPGCGVVVKSHPERHWRVHTKEKPYKCMQCDQCFTAPSSLRRHERAHNDDKPHACKTCHMKFRDTFNLSEHEKTHTGEKPFKCDECDNNFRTKNQLLVHERTHTGEKPFQCYECDKSFAQSNDLTKHIRTHTGEKPYKCHYCDKSFAQSGTLTMHIRIHTGQKPYKCEFKGCEFASAQKGSLDSHFWRMHTDEGQKQHKAEEDRMYKAFLLKGVTIDARGQRISFSCMGDTWAAPDFTIQKPKRIVFGECDEHQHKDRILKCLLARVIKIQTSQVIAGETRNLVFLWVNPHSYKVDGMPGKMKYEERIDKTVDIIENFEPTQPITIYKVCYDMTTNSDTGEKYPCIFDDPDYDEVLKPFVKWVF